MTKLDIAVTVNSHLYRCSHAKHEVAPFRLFPDMQTLQSHSVRLSPCVFSRCVSACCKGERLHFAGALHSMWSFSIQCIQLAHEVLDIGFTVLHGLGAQLLRAQPRLLPEPGKKGFGDAPLGSLPMCFGTLQRKASYACWHIAGNTATPHIIVLCHGQSADPVLEGRNVLNGLCNGPPHAQRAELQCMLLARQQKAKALS